MTAAPAPTTSADETKPRVRPAARLAESLADADAARRSSGVTALRGKTTVATAIELAAA
ncbi:hypothetical protein [Streptomyces decoyicus]|uniref:hypothetical protein n=1 Tax=Streptomyces decoyicus TaxID=249567 RepID=UPI0033B9A88B